jgi:exopolysaccharide biosynthesis polyprenyl glycosylphosphotransferase
MSRSGKNARENMLKPAANLKKVPGRKNAASSNTRTAVTHDKYAYCVINYFIDRDSGLYVENYFAEMLRLERKRTQRSRKPFLLMTISVENILQSDKKDEVVRKISSALFSCTREIDMKGWHKYNALIGVVFREMNRIEKDVIKISKDVIEQKVCNRLGELLNAEEMDKIELHFHIFPEDPKKQEAGSSLDMNLYPDVSHTYEAKKHSFFLKRCIDVIGSIAALIICSPCFVIIPLLIKLSSNGPVFFRQERLGLHGKSFTFLKFRSMHVNNDNTIHKEYVKKLITGENESNDGSGSGQQRCCYKLRNDPRITPFGRIIRKTSFDELPQFLNVLKGDMSLVGPRPAIPYELENYDIWHRRRLLEVKPGITGMWQVHGRSSTTFDEMVRLDLTYIRNRSMWLDIKILLRTPMAVVFGRGAY